MNYKERHRVMDQDKDFVEAERLINLYRNRSPEDVLLRRLFGFFPEDFPQRPLPIIEEYLLSQGQTLTITLESATRANVSAQRGTHGNEN
jgi:hypothetical protein